MLLFLYCLIAQRKHTHHETAQADWLGLKLMTNKLVVIEFQTIYIKNTYILSRQNSQCLAKCF